MIKNISVMLRSLFCSEGTIVLLVAGIIAYLFVCMSLAYSKELGPFSALCGVAVFSMAAIAVVVMASHMHALASRKTISLLARSRMALLIAGFVLCVICTIFMAPYIYLMRASFLVAMKSMAAFFCIYSFILISGVFLAKYITPAISFGLALIAIPLIGAMFVKLIGSEKQPLFVIALMLLFVPVMWLLFGMWFLRKKIEKLDDGSNWAQRMAAFFSRLMHSSNFLTGVGTILLNNGDSTKALVRRSLIVVGIYLFFGLIICVVVYSKHHNLNEFNDPIGISMFCIFQLIYLEITTCFNRFKNIWLLSDGDRKFVLNMRKQLLTKIALIHYGITLVVALCLSINHLLAGSLAYFVMVAIAIFYMAVHVLLIRNALNVDNKFIFLPFVYPALIFSKRLVEVSANGVSFLSADYFAWSFVLAPPLVAFIMCFIVKNKTEKIDFSQRGKNVRPSVFQRLINNGK